MSSENSKRRTRPTGPSTTADGRDPMEVWEEQQEALRNMTPEELAAYLDGLVERQRELQPQLSEEADWRKEMRRREN